MRILSPEFDAYSNIEPHCVKRVTAIDASIFDLALDHTFASLPVQLNDPLE